MTTIRLLTGLSRPTAAQAHVLGLDLATNLPRIKKQICTDPSETRRLVGEEPASLVREALVLAESEGECILSVNTILPASEDVSVQLAGLR
jgi:hypothetical protein